LQQRAREQPVEIAFVGEDHIGFWQCYHGGGRLVQPDARGERGVSIHFARTPRWLEDEFCPKARVGHGD
jgi:hypothetical protein